MDYENIKNEIQKFVDDRNWEESHSPKNLAMALSVEASELVDIFYYTVRICQKMDIDLEQAFYEKMKKNIIKHPKPN